MYHIHFTFSTRYSVNFINNLKKPKVNTSTLFCITYIVHFYVMPTFLCVFNTKQRYKIVKKIIKSTMQINEQLYFGTKKSCIANENQIYSEEAMMQHNVKLFHQFSLNITSKILWQKKSKDGFLAIFTLFLPLLLHNIKSEMSLYTKNLKACDLIIKLIKRNSSRN